MAWSRRQFVRSAAVGGSGLLLARGREAGAVDTVRTSSPLIRLDSNENAAGLNRSAMAALQDAMGLANRYPFRFPTTLSAAIAKAHGIAHDHVLTGCGSSEILLNAVLACTDASRGLLAPSPTFEEPARVARRLRRPVHEVPVDASLRIDLDGLTRLADQAGLIFLCNPNNPTSTAVPADDLAIFVKDAQRRAPDVMVLIDEAYIEYADAGGVRSALPLALEQPRVIISRTFSKMYGMAGLRVGYAIGQAETLRRLAAWSLPMGVNTLGLHAAAAALQDQGFEARERARNAEARAFTVQRLTAAGARVVPSHANFVMADVGRESTAFRQACQDQGVAVGRAFPPLTNYSRISIGTLDEMRKACPVFERVLRA